MSHSPISFQDVEEHIIQANGLMKALQKIACDDGAEISVMQALDERLKILEQDFHKLWKQQSIVSQYINFDTH